MAVVALVFRYVHAGLQIHTFGKNLPFARLRSAISRHSLVQLLKQILHLTASLSLGQFVAHSQFRRSAVITHARGWHALVLQTLDGPVLHAVMVRCAGIGIFGESSLAHGHLRVGRENATPY